MFKYTSGDVEDPRNFILPIKLAIAVIKIYNIRLYYEATMMIFNAIDKRFIIIT